MNNEPNPEERKRIVDSVMANAGMVMPQETEDQKIMRKAMEATKRIRDQFLPIIVADGYPSRKKHGLAIGKAFLEEFHSWPKEDLVYLCCVIHMDALLEKMR